MEKSKIKQVFFKKLVFIAAAVIMCFHCGAVNVNAQDEKMLIPVGDAVGINIKTKGMIVSSVGEIQDGGKIVSPGKDAGIKAGDIITQINGLSVNTADELITALEDTAGCEIAVNVIRKGEVVSLTAVPYEDENGDGKLGLWLRDGLTGIGTVTYYDPETCTYGALGHSVSDIDSGVLVPVLDGEIMKSQICDVIKGIPGKPGQLSGEVIPDTVMGNVTLNTESGIFGKADSYIATGACEPMPVCRWSEVETGPATILSNVNGEEICEYDVAITRLYPGDDGDMRDMMITVTDDELIEKTGGIVQGMSGSPIIQNGKIVGAVTHVLIGNPSKGYGIFIENMLDAAG